MKRVEYSRFPSIIFSYIYGLYFILVILYIIFKFNLTYFQLYFLLYLYQFNS